MFEYLRDARDRVLFQDLPILMTPRFGVLDPLDYGQQRLLAARQGVFLEARTRALHLILPVAQAIMPLPYGSLRAKVELAGGPLPYALYDKMRAAAVATLPHEWAGAVVYTPGTGYELIEPTPESVSAGHVRYRTEGIPDERLVLDIHSHGYGAAYFSLTDDASDRQGGVYLASVLGRCVDYDSIRVVTRIVVHGRFFPVTWTPWEAGPGGGAIDRLERAP